MQRVLIILFLIIGFINQSQAQNYRLIDKDRTRTYAKIDTSAVDSIFNFIKIDSAFELGPDSIFYFNKQLQEIGLPDCAFLTGDTTAMGNRMILLSDTDATHIFFNKNNDSIFIKTIVEVGDVWHMYDWPDGSYVKATVINKLLRFVLPDAEDTVIRIQLNVFNSAGTILVDTFPNQTKIDITENFGIIEFFDFNLFPKSNDSLTFLLRGLSDPDMDIVDVEAETAFDYKLGYEFHYREEIAPDVASGGDKRISAWKYFVMGKTQEINSVTYTMERVMFDTIYFGAVPTAAVTWDTVTVTYNYADYAFLDTLEMSLFEASMFGYSDWKVDTLLYGGFAHKYVYDWYDYNAVTGCLTNPDNIAQPEQLYGGGLGIIHYQDSSSSDEYYNFDLVYFHVGLIEWGTPYDFSILDLEVNNSKPQDLIKIYPNPVHDIINLQVESIEKNILKIFTIDGKELFSYQVIPAAGVIQVSVGALPEGYYLIEITSNEKTSTGKFIKF